MTVTINDSIVGPSRITAKQLLTWHVNTFDRLASPAVVDYLIELERLCNLVNFDLLLLAAQSSHETANWTSEWWARRRNPAGIGITGDPAENEASQTWANGTDAARAHVVHMWAYVGQGVPPDCPIIDYSLAGIDQRYRAVYEADLESTVRVLGDLGNGRWAVDPNYAPQIAARANEMIRGMEVEPVTTYQIVGLPGPGIELPVPLAHRIIDKAQTNQRPGITRQLPGYWVQHETDNHAVGADAMMHARYLEAGAEGRQASWHFTVDDGIIVQHIPIDEVTWQAADGAGPGNMSGISCELCVNAGINTEKARRNAEALAAGILKALGMSVDRCKRHWDFNYALASPPCSSPCDRSGPDRHHCPDTIMDDGYWPVFVAHVGAIIAITPTPIYATPDVPEWFPVSVEQTHPSDASVDGVRWFVLRRNFEALKNTNRYSRPDTTSPKSGPKILTREKIVCERYFKDANKRSWIVEPDGSYVTAASFTPAVTIRSR